jgi:hypothetical protein
MRRSVLRFWLTGVLTATALAGCRDAGPVRSGPDGPGGREPPLRPESHARGGWAVPATAAGPAPGNPTPVLIPAAATEEPSPTEDAPAAPAEPSDVAPVPPLVPPFSADGPEVSPPHPVPQAEPVTENREPSAPCDEHRSLVGKLELGAEPGTWSLRYDPEGNRPGGVVNLVAPHPLTDCREGREARVEGRMLQEGREAVFEVEYLTVSPPR